MTENTSARINAVDAVRIDPTDIDAIERACAAMYPASETASVVRDVLAGLRWALSTGGEITVTVTRGSGS